MCELLKTNTIVASRAFVYTNAILLCKMLVGLCPNPICSASCRCRLRVFSKRFYLYMVEFQDSCALQFWWRHLKPNEQPATASTVSEVMMLAVLRSERKTFDIFAGSWYTTSNPCESVGGDCVAFPVLSCSWRSKQRRTIYRCIYTITVETLNSWLSPRRSKRRWPPTIRETTAFVDYRMSQP